MEPPLSWKMVSGVINDADHDDTVCFLCGSKDVVFVSITGNCVCEACLWQS